MHGSFPLAGQEWILQAEGVAEAVVLWALSREIRALAEMAFEMEQGNSAERVMGAYRVWEKRKPLVRKGLVQWGYRMQRLASKVLRPLLRTGSDTIPHNTTGKPRLGSQIVHLIDKPMPSRIPAKLDPALCSAIACGDGP